MYKRQGTYYYKIAEVKSGAGDGIIYDQNEFIVTVNVTYNDAAGKFAVAIDYPENGVTFVNTVEEKHEIEISKVDIGGIQLAEAKIQIKQGDDVVKEWTTKAGGNEKLSLEAGEYVFHEKEAPAGYDTVGDFTFAVDSEGKVTVENAAAKAEGSKLTVTDQLDVYKRQDHRYCTIQK